MTDDPDNVFFKKLLDLVPAQAYFKEDKKNIIRNQGDEDGPPRKKSKKRHSDPFNRQSVTSLQTTLNAMEEKIKGKKDSKAKRKKNKDKAGNDKVSMLELQAKLKARIEELQAKRAGTALTEEEKQEQKRLERKRKKLDSKVKNKQKKTKTDTAETSTNATPATDSNALNAQKTKKASKPIFNKEGKMVFSKFDFTETGEKDSAGKGALVGKDYKRLLKKLEQRDEKVSKVKERDPAAAAKLEQKHAWQDVLSKARGDKVKDDKHLLQKAIKHKEKLKEKRTKKWQQRTQAVEQRQKQRQEKRQKNIQARKDAKKEKLKKKMIKKGRLLPGF